MTDKRKVSDILDFGGPVAFDEIKHGEYQGICPWCALDLEVVTATVYGDLYNALVDVQAPHMDTCAQRLSTEMAVEVRGPVSEAWN